MRAIVYPSGKVCTHVIMLYNNYIYIYSPLSDSTFPERALFTIRTPQTKTKQYTVVIHMFCFASARKVTVM